MARKTPATAEEKCDAHIAAMREQLTEISQLLDNIEDTHSKDWAMTGTLYESRRLLSQAIAELTPF